MSQCGIVLGRRGGGGVRISHRQQREIKENEDSPLKKWQTRSAFVVKIIFKNNENNNNGTIQDDSNCVCC